MSERRGHNIARAFMPRLGVLYQYSARPLVLPFRYKHTRMPAEPPSISIVTPSLNSGRFIEKTIVSVLDQDYPRLEYAVQDGGSTDATHEIVEAYASRLFSCESAPDNGQAAAVNYALSRMSGEIMAYLNADDLLLPGSLAYVAKYFVRHPEVDVVYSHRVVVDEYDREVGKWVLPRHDSRVLSWVDFVPQETMFWRRSIWERAGPLDESFNCVFDWDLIIRFRDAGAQFARLPRFLGALRVHPDQKIQRLSEAAAEEANVLRRRIHGRTVTQAEMLVTVWPYLVRHLMMRWAYHARVLRY